MASIDELRMRYAELNGIRPASTEFLDKIESLLELRLPRAFRLVCEFFDGAGIYTIPLFSLSGTAPRLNPLSETERLRIKVGLPKNYLVLAEPPASLIVMDCDGEGAITWLDAIDAERIGERAFSRPPDCWHSFEEFFCYLLDEEFADRQ
ncbi:SMI1/KNR4 family protein [Achromobacter spanius]|uniref:SMI1/KNR4 family protein n=1 Tax=Achromobacter spanius TaxID=217203 RepID=UPI00381FB86F